jgi:hypothetical protein
MKPSSQPLQNLLVNKLITDKNLLPAANTVKTEKLPGKNKMKFDALVAKGLIKHEQDDYTISITYENSVLKVNGILIPLKTGQRDE